MITIIHGANIAVSRKFYIDLRSQAKNPLIFSGETMQMADLVQALEGQGLFEATQELFIEDLLSKRKQSKELDTLVTYITAHEKDNTIVLWESKELTPKQSKTLAKAEIKKIDIPKVIFNFLDSLQPNNVKQAIQLFHQVIATEEETFVFFMIVRHVRILLALVDPGDASIDEVARLAPWQKGKTIKQATSFGKERLIELYDQLYTIESNLKVGQLSTSLIAAIDFFLMNL